MNIGIAFQQLREANPVPDPALLTDPAPDFGSLLAARRQRSTEMQTDELTRPKSDKPQKPGRLRRPDRRPWLLTAAAAAATAVVVIGALLVIPNFGGSSDVADQPPPAPIDISAADPIQAINDQASRVTINFAGNARALAEGGAHLLEIQVYLEGSRELAPDVTVVYTSTDGVITPTGSSPTGSEVTATWVWFADDGLQVTLRHQGFSIPDTRPEVLVSVQATASSEAVEFVMDSPAGPTG